MKKRPYYIVCLWFIGSIFFLLTLTFFLGELNPIDPVLAMVGETAQESVFEAAREQLGLNQTLPVRYWSFVKSYFSGDFGTTRLSGAPVLEELLLFLPLTLNLALMGLIFAMTLGVTVGVLTALFPMSPLDRFVRFFIIIGHSLPNFFIAYGVLMAVMHARSGAFCESGSNLVGLLLQGRLDDAICVWEQLCPAAVVLGYLGSAYMARMTRNFILRELNEPYVLTARIKKLSTAHILFKHVWPNVRGQVLSLAMLGFVLLVEGSVVTETVFALPGIGAYITRAILANDQPAILGATFVIGTFVIVANTFRDFLIVKMKGQQGKKVRDDE